MKLDTVSARARLAPRREPYWQRVGAGRQVGCRVLEGGLESWIAKFRDPESGKRYLNALGAFDDLPRSERHDAAMKAARAWFEHLRAGGTHETQTVKDACVRYVEVLKRTKGEHASRDVQNRFARFIYDTDLARIDLDKLNSRHVAKWRERLQDTLTVQRTQRSASTLNRDMTRLRAALNLARAEQFVMSDTSWAQALRPIKDADRSRNIYLDPSQREKLLQYIDDADMLLFVEVLCSIPLRPGALADLKIAAYDRRLKALTIGKDKAHDGRSFVLTAPLAKLFEKAAHGKLPSALLFTYHGLPWVKERWRGPFKKAVVAAGLPHATLYTVRHSGITDLVHGGADLLTVAQISGTSLRMIELHYGHLTNKAATAALEKLSLRR